MLDFGCRARTPTRDISYADSGPAAGPVVILIHGWPDAARVERPGRAPECVGLPDHLAGAARRGRHALFLRGDRVRRLGRRARDRRGRSRGCARHRTVRCRRPRLGCARRLHDCRAVSGARAPHRCAGAGVSAARGVQAAGFLAGAALLVSMVHVARWRPGRRRCRSEGLCAHRIQWETWSPPGWFDEAEFATTARASFENPDWVPVTFNAYRRRDQPSDPALAERYAQLATIERIGVPALMIQGGADSCDEPSSSQGQEQYFPAGWRVLIDGAGHFPLREVPDAVADEIVAH